ncbi:MAG TPA: cytochrome c [Gemmatimonadales bacterium]|nr:cytochrome c [Gemmatimonadales bacterium]
MRRGRWRPASLGLLAALAAACTVDKGSWDRALQRMNSQPRGHPFGATPVFPDGKVMQRPPAGTVARDAARPSDTVAPAAYTAAMLARGRSRFDVFCAACHGPLGDGVSVVAANMRPPRPPSLVTPPISALTPESVYAVITRGFGRMPPLAPYLTPAERWAVIGYLRALRLSREVALDTLPPALAAEARRALER